MKISLKIILYNLFKLKLYFFSFFYLPILFPTMSLFAKDTQIKPKKIDPPQLNTPYELRIGVLLPKNGALSDYGVQTLLGLDFARKKISHIYPNSKIFVQDTQSTPQGSAEAANQLISDKVHVLIGELATTNTQAAATIAKSNKIPIISIGSTFSELSDGNPYFFRICLIDEFQGDILAKFALNDPMHAKKAYVLVDQDSTYSKELSHHFSEEFKKGGGQILNLLSFSQNVRDFKSIVAKMRKIPADVIFIPAYHQQVAPLLREIKLQKIKGHILGSDGWDSPGLVSMAGTAAEGTYYSSHYAIDFQDKKSIDFKKEFISLMGVSPSTYSVMTYDAILMAAAAALRTKHPIDLVKILKDKFSYQGVSGSIVLDEKGNPKKDVFIMKIVNNKPKFWSKVSK